MIFFPSTLTLLLIIGNIFGVAMLIPQARKLARTNHMAGVSPRWVGLGFAINAGWLAYGLLADLPGLIPVSAGALVLYGWMLATLRRIPQSGIAQALTTGGTLIAALIITGVVGGVTAMGILGLGFLYIVQFAPAAWESSRSADLSGIAPMTWVMALTEAAIWAIYARSTGDIGLLLGGIGASAMSIIVLANLYRAGRSSRRQTRSLSSVVT